MSMYNSHLTVMISGNIKILTYFVNIVERKQPLIPSIFTLLVRDRSPFFYHV